MIVYPSGYSKSRAKPASDLRASSGETITYAELDVRTIDPAHFLRQAAVLSAWITILL